MGSSETPCTLYIIYMYNSVHVLVYYLTLCFRRSLTLSLISANFLSLPSSCLLRPTCAQKKLWFWVLLVHYYLVHSFYVGGLLWGFSTQVYFENSLMCPFFSFFSFLFQQYRNNFLLACFLEYELRAYLFSTPIVNYFSFLISLYCNFLSLTHFLQDLFVHHFRILLWKK